MKRVIELKESWAVKCVEPVERLGSELLGSLAAEEPLRELDWYPASMPAQVHEILMEAGVIDDPRKSGKVRECLWVAEKDWVYKYTFRHQAGKEKAYLNFKGLDTLVDVYLNGMLIGQGNDLYLPLRLEVTEFVEEDNVLLVHFHSPHKYLESCDMPDEWKGKIAKHRLMRKQEHDFQEYLGPKPYFTKIGIYDKVLLEYVDGVEISCVDIDYTLKDGFDKARIKIAVEVEGCTGKDVVKVALKSPDGNTITASSEEKECCLCEGKWQEEFYMEIDNPILWWPRGYGKQPLYEVVASVESEGRVKDTISKKTGLREMEMIGPFDYKINGKRIKLWGGNFTPVDGITHCFNADRVKGILFMAENCNMNTLRIWGGGERYGDELYDEADSRGLLLWQEFFNEYGMHPDTPGYRELCKKEAEYQVNRLKHHPSIFMWCGGNENYMGRDFSFPGEKYIGKELFNTDYREVTSRLDPSRYYHPTSPFGGAYANDPLDGDTHSYTNTWFVPGSDYPVMTSENLRTSIPRLSSFKRFVDPDKLWPEDYSPLFTHDDIYPWPDGWTERTTAESWRKIPEIEKFYDPTNAEEAIYRFGAAYGLYLRQTVERYRRGKPWWNAFGDRVCKGHYVWKLNSTWPHIYSNVIDYYLEAYIPYYALKRAYEPLLLSFEVSNFIYLWVVNDTADEIKGNVNIKLFNPRSNQTLKEFTVCAGVLPGESKLLTDLNRFAQFDRGNMLFAEFTDENGNIIARTNDYVDIERHLKFPDAKVELKMQDGYLVVTTDRFARCIELTGNENGDDSGWIFEDNYFDLLPGEVKKVRIFTNHKEGSISAKAHYSRNTAEVAYKKIN